MSYKNYSVRISFVKDESGAVEYILPHVFSVDDPEPEGKDIVIHGTRGDGAIRIKGGKKSHSIIVKGNLFDADGYKELTDKINEMRLKVTRDNAILTLEHLEGASWISDWSFRGFRNEEIRFEKSLRTGKQEYTINFLVTNYN